MLDKDTSCVVLNWCLRFKAVAGVQAAGYSPARLCRGCSVKAGPDPITAGQECSWSFSMGAAVLWPGLCSGL